MTHERPPVTAKDLTLRLLEILNEGAFDRLGDVFADDVITDWPQSGERVRGLANAMEVFKHYPGGQTGTLASDLQYVQGDDDRYVLTPLFTAVRAVGSEHDAVTTVRTRYPDGSDWYVITIAKILNGKIVKNTQYFAPCYDPPEWRAEWVEHI